MRVAVFAAVAGWLFFLGAPSTGQQVTLDKTSIDAETRARVSRAAAGRLAQLELVEKTEGGAESVVFRGPAVVMGAHHAITIVPSAVRQRLSVGEGGAAKTAPASTASAATPAAAPAATSAAGGALPARSALELRVLLGEGANVRKFAGRVAGADPQTGLVVVQANDLPGSALSFDPMPVLAKDTRVVLVEPGPDGKPVLHGGKLVQSRAHLDQGKGKNPLLLFRLDEASIKGLDGKGSRGKSSGEKERPARWEDVASRKAGAFLTDAQGGFLGIVTPAVLERRPAAAAGSSSAGKTAGGEIAGKALSGKESAGDSQRSALREGEVLALPAEIARLLSDSLVRGIPVARGYFGASFREIADPPEEVRRLGAGRSVALVERVYPGGPADQGGLRKGDWLVAIAEKKGITYAEVVRFSELVEYTGQGKVVELVVARPGHGEPQQLSLKIRIGKR